MTPTLSDEQRQALAHQPGQPLRVEDPVTHAQYMLIELDAFEQLRRTADLDTCEPDPRDYYPAFAEAVRQDLDAPGMEKYDEDTPAPDRS